MIESSHDTSNVIYEPVYNWTIVHKLRGLKLEANIVASKFSNALANFGKQFPFHGRILSVNNVGLVK